MGTAAAKKLALKALQLFPPYRWDEQQEVDWIEDVMRETAHFSDAVLNAATTEMVRKRKRKDGTPAVSECIAYCAEAKRWKDAEDEKGSLPIRREPDVYVKYPAWTDSRKRLADDLICGRNGRPELGRQAAKDHYWITQLWDYCRENQKLPNDNEIAALKRKAKDVDDVFASFAPGDGPASKLGLWAIQTATEKRNQLCDMVLHGVVRP